MSLEQQYRTTGRTGPRSRKPLALCVALILSGVAFILAAGDAWAQQRYAPAKSYAAITGQGPAVADIGAAGPEVEASPTVEETPPVGSGPASKESPPADSTLPPVDQRDLGLASQLESLPDLTAYGVPEPVSVLSEEFESTPELALELQVPASSLNSPPLPGGLVAFENNGALLSRAERESSAGVRPVPLPENGLTNALVTGHSSPVTWLKTPAPVVPKPPVSAPAVPGPASEASRLLLGLESVASSAVETLHSAAANTAAGVSKVVATHGSSESSPAGAESPSEGAPSPPAPPAPVPPGGSSFSLSGGGQVGPGGGVAPLLLCVLAAGFILLRPDGRLSWASCELPKPSSALLTPLLRPG